jgi:MFS family permease
MILVGMACWVVRYALFAFGAPEQVTWMLLLGILLHGICYDFFFVTGFMYTDQKAPEAIRGQAQGLLVFLTQGIGMFFGYRVAFGGSFMGIPLDWTIGDYGKQVTSSDAYVAALKEARGEQPTVSFVESLTQMFSKNLPDTLDPELLNTTMAEWKNFWLFPSIMAAVILVIFAVTFWDKAKQTDATES